MSGKLITSSVAGRTPTTTNLDTQQVGVNTADGKIYVNDGSEIVDVLQETLDVAATNAASEADDALSDAQTYTDSKAVDAISQAATYTDQEVADAKAYTDQEVEKIDPLGDHEFLLKASQRAAILAANEERYAASGMVHAGRAFPVSDDIVHHINEGMYTDTNKANLLLWGEDPTQSGEVGTSKTAHPVTHIAGVVSNVMYSNNTIWNPSQKYGSRNIIKLPPAPKGYDVYDSSGNVRGSGKATLNLRTEVDPKYGDIASTDNEAVARAFEGMVKNGDFRNGATDWNTTGGQATFDSTGVTLVSSGSTNASVISSIVFPTNTEVEVSFYVEQVPVSGGVQVRQYGVGGNDGIIFTAVTTGLHTIRYNTGSLSDNHSRDNALMLRNGSATNDVTSKVSSVSFKVVTEEVVTDRVDMFGLEQFDMVMKDDEVFDMVQSSAATFGDTDVPTVVSSRPDTFFAVYEGQEGITKGRCVKWSTLTKEQKRKVAAYMKERLWINEDNEITFTTIRQRSFAGPGNGDWANVIANGKFGSAAHNGMLRFDTATNSYVNPQGDTDSVPSYSDSSRRFKGYNDSPLTGLTPGVFVAADTNSESSRAYKGRCFFYVLGTASRLNQGAYYPNLNESGTDRLNGNTSSGSYYWYSTQTIQPTTKAQCFHFVSTWTDTTTSGRLGIGNIAGNGSGRSDSRFYNAIYAGGLGGVVDLRLPAYGSTNQDAYQMREKVKKGKYRGKMHLPYSKASLVTVTGQLVWTNRTRLSTNLSYSEDDGSDMKLIVGTDGQSYVIDEPVNEGGLLYFYLLAGYGDVTANFPAGDYGVLRQVAQENPVSLSGNLIVREVIADLADISTIDILKDGWFGTWNPKTPTGVNDDYVLNRIATDDNSDVLITTDSGATWTTGTSPVDLESNSINRTLASGDVALIDYQMWADMVEPSDPKKVFGGSAGILPMFITSSYLREDGAILAGNTLRMVQSDNKTAGTEDLGEARVTLNNSGIVTAAEHGSIFYRPSPSAGGISKTLMYVCSEEGQASLSMFANQGTWTSFNGQETSQDFTATTWTEGERYRITGNLAITGMYVCVRDRSTSLDSDFVTIFPNGDIGSIGGAITYLAFKYVGSRCEGYGMDGSFHVPVSAHPESFADIFGEFNQSTHTSLTLPYGWIHNHATAGTREDGIDV